MHRSHNWSQNRMDWWVSELLDYCHIYQLDLTWRIITSYFWKIRQEFLDHTLSHRFMYSLIHTPIHSFTHSFTHSLTHSPLTFYTLDVIVKWLITVLCTEWYGTSSVVAGWQDDNAPLSWASKLVQSAIWTRNANKQIRTKTQNLENWSFYVAQLAY